MNYALGHAFNINHLFQNFPFKKLITNCKKCAQINKGDNHRNKLVYKVFLTSMEIIFNDIIENNVTFELPTSSRKSDIHMLRVTGDDFAQARQNGKWLDIDYLKSFFSGYKLVLTMYNREGKPSRVKPIYLDKKFTNKITELTNQGKQYC